MIRIAAGCLLSACGVMGMSVGVGREMGVGGSLMRQPGAAGERPIAIVDGQAIYPSLVAPAMYEAVGANVLADAVLDIRLDRQAKLRQLSLSDADIAAERMALIESLREAGLATDQSIDALSEVRKSRGLGDSRYEALLRRNAMLRKLVQPEIILDEAVLRQAFAIRYGEKIQARVLAVDSQSKAGQVRQAIAADALAAGRAGEVPALLFAEHAYRNSLDETGARGGLMATFSVEDPTIPMTLRTSARTLKPGQMSGVLAIEGGFAILLVTGSTPATGARFEDVRSQLERDVRRRQERIAMDALVKRLLAEPGVTIMDRSLGWSWRAAGRQ